jgi:hypothetical protein
MESGTLVWYIFWIISLLEVRFYNNVTWGRPHPIKDIVMLKVVVVAGILVSFILDDNVNII